LEQEDGTPLGLGFFTCVFLSSDFVAASFHSLAQFC
jgi:hypothetical protein